MVGQGDFGPARPNSFPVPFPAPSAQAMFSVTSVQRKLIVMNKGNQ